MSYLFLGQEENIEATPPDAAVVVENSTEDKKQFARRLLNKPFPPPKEIAEGSAATKKGPGPSEEQIDAVYKAVRQHVGDAVIDELNYKMGALMKGYGRDMMKSSMATAAVDMGIGIALACAGPVGWVIGLVYSVVRLVAGSINEREAQAIIANAQNEAMLLEAAWDAKLKKEQEKIFREETPAGIKLAMALALDDTLPVAGTVNGLGAFDRLQTRLQERRSDLTPEEVEKRKKLATAMAIYLGTNAKAQQNITKTWENTVTSLMEDLGMKEKEESTLEKAVDSTRGAIRKYGYSGLFAASSGMFIPPNKEIMAKVSNFGKGAAEHISGHIAVTKAKEVSRLCLDQAKLKIQTNFYLTQKQMEDPEYRAQLRLVIAQQILQNPEIIQMLVGVKAARQQIGTQVKPQEVPAIQQSSLPQKPKTGLLIGGGAAALLAYLYFS